MSKTTGRTAKQKPIETLFLFDYVIKTIVFKLLKKNTNDKRDIYVYILLPFSSFFFFSPFVLLRPFFGAIFERLTDSSTNSAKKQKRIQAPKHALLVHIRTGKLLTNSILYLKENL